MDWEYSDKASSHGNLNISEKLRANIEMFQKVANTLNREIETNAPFKASLKIYAKHIIYEGALKERTDFIGGLNTQLFLHNKTVVDFPIVKQA